MNFYTIIDGNQVHINGNPDDETMAAITKMVKLARTKLKQNNMEDVALPQYQSHKIVGALKIKEIILDQDLAKETNRETDGSALITPVEEGYAPFKVDHSYVSKHKPLAGGYYVVYEDGYTSWSPSPVFEKG